MRNIVLSLILAAVTSVSAQNQVTVTVDTTDAAQAAVLAELDSIQAARVAEGADSTRVRLQAHVDSLDLSLIGGVTLISDTRDSMWVQIAFVDTMSGLANTIIKNTVRDALGSFNARSVDSYTIRMSRARAKQFLTAVDSDLNP